jgi:cytochrome c peroxidase
MREYACRRLSTNARRTLVCGSALAAAVLALSLYAPPASAKKDPPVPAAPDEDALIELGKNFFFDKQLSTPRGKQSCASCHEPKVGWVLPLSDVNETTVGAPGAQPGEQGRRKVQTNAYASFSPAFRFQGGAGPRGA